MKVLVSAYSCEPGKGSDPGIGWHSACQAARFHDVWVLTHEESRPAMEAAPASEAFGSTRVIYLDLPPWALFWRKGHWGVQVHYYLWQLAAYFVGRRLHRKVGFDLIHHVTLVRYWMPSYLALLPVPFIWGPVGGAESAPRAFWWSFSFQGKIFELLRDLARKMFEYDVFVRLTARKAALGLAMTKETAERMRMLGCGRVSLLSGLGLAQEEIRRLSLIPIRQNGPFRLLSIGRLLHWKGFHLSVRAFAEFQRQFPGSEYWVIGEGPERGRLRKLAQKLGVAESLTFWGDIPRQQVLEKLAECDVLIHPSLHDSGGWVCLEAMAAGRPVVCLDLGGPGVQVTEKTGIKVQAGTPDQAVVDLAKAILRLAEAPDLRARMAEASRQRVIENFSWESKGDFMSEIYQNMVASPLALIRERVAEGTP
jgi:glycosyltransferase involved in cell wall biosynthesis